VQRHFKWVCFGGVVMQKTGRVGFGVSATGRETPGLDETAPMDGAIDGYLSFAAVM
jgi:hypothetical protein